MRQGIKAAMAVAMMSLIAGSATAASLSFMPRVLDKSAQAPVREGDFDNDGRVDQVLILPEAGTGRFEIQIRFNRSEGTQTRRVMTLGAEAFLPDSGLELQVVPAGRYEVDCGDYSDDCTADVIDATSDSLRLSMSGASVLMYWDGERFVQDFVKTDALENDRATERALGLLGAL